MSTASSPLNKSGEPTTWNFKLLAQHELGGFGGMGEGMSVQIAPDGRRIIWLAHESAPKNFTAVDVSDPRKPKVVCQTDLPQSHMRSNSLETCGNIMAVAYQTQKKGLKPAGMELFDISKPENPKSIGFYNCSGEHSLFARAVVEPDRLRILRLGDVEQLHAGRLQALLLGLVGDRHDVPAGLQRVRAHVALRQV